MLRKVLRLAYFPAPPERAAETCRLRISETSLFQRLFQPHAKNNRPCMYVCDATFSGGGAPPTHSIIHAHVHAINMSWRPTSLVMCICDVMRLAKGHGPWLFVLRPWRSPITADLGSNFPSGGCSHLNKDFSATPWPPSHLVLER